MNNRIDYYNKGELLGNLLDLEIRHRTQNKKTLLDVFHYLFQNNALPKPGFEEKRGFRNAVETITREAAPNDADFGDFFAKYVSGTEEIPWNDFLKYAGLMLEQKPGKPEPWIGINTGRNIPSNFPGGAPTVLPEGQIAVTGIRSGSPGAAAGLDIGDVIVAFNDQQVNAANFADLLKAQKAGAEVPITVFRRGNLETMKVKIESDPTNAFTVKEIPDPDEMQRQILTSWLGEAKPKSPTKD